MAYSMLISSLCNQVINALPNKKLLGYGYLEQMRDILPGILISVFMGVCVKMIEFIPMPLILTLIVQVMSGVIIYVLLSKLFKLESFEYLLGILRSLLSGRKKKGKKNEG